MTFALVVYHGYMCPGFLLEIEFREKSFIVFCALTKDIDLHLIFRDLVIGITQTNVEGRTVDDTLVVITEIGHPYPKFYREIIHRESCHVLGFESPSSTQVRSKLSPWFIK